MTRNEGYDYLIAVAICPTIKDDGTRTQLRLLYELEKIIIKYSDVGGVAPPAANWCSLALCGPDDDDDRHGNAKQQELLAQLEKSGSSF